MRLNKWSATIAVVTLLLSGGSLADLGKPRTAANAEDPNAASVWSATAPSAVSTSEQWLCCFAHYRTLSYSVTRLG
jgi:hypothetical protein